MKNLTFVALLIIVSISTITASMWSIHNSPRYKLGDQALELIEECEATLPRDQFCTLKAVKPQELLDVDSRW